MSNISNNSTRINLLKDFTAFISGLLLPLSLSPFDYYICSFISVILLLYSISGELSIKRALLRGYLYGLTSFTFGVGWIYVSIHEHGNASPLLAAGLTLSFVMLVLAFFPAIKLAGYQFLSKKLNLINNSLKLLLVFPCIWVIVDWLRSWVFTGFPWLYLGYSLTDTSLNSFAPIVSIFGLTFIVVFFSSCFFIIIRNFIELYYNNNNKHKLNQNLNYILILTVILITSSSLQNIEWTKKQKNSENVVLIQGNISQDNKWKNSNEFSIINTYLRLTKPYLKNSTIIWPETAIITPKHNLEKVFKKWDLAATNNNSTIIFGIPILNTVNINSINLNNNTKNKKTKNQQYFNAIASIGIGGNHEYYKNKLVPWGEYVPFEQYLRGLIAFFDLPMSNMISGNLVTPNFNIIKSQSIKWLPFICYEIAYPDYVISNAHKGDAIVTISNDAWFGNSIGPWQHLQLARMRALETARPVARSTNNGITVMIAPDGKIIKQIPQFKQGIVENKLSGYTGITPIMYIGVKSIIAICFLVIFIIFLLNFLKQAKTQKKYKKNNQKTNQKTSVLN